MEDQDHRLLLMLGTRILVGGSFGMRCWRRTGTSYLLSITEELVAEEEIG